MGYSEIEVTDRVKIRVSELKKRDYFEFFSKVYRVIEVTDRIEFRPYIGGEKTKADRQGFGLHSKQFVYKVLIKPIKNEHHRFKYRKHSKRDYTSGKLHRPLLSNAGDRHYY